MGMTKTEQHFWKFPWRLRHWRPSKAVCGIVGHRPPVLRRIAGMQSVPMCRRCDTWMGELVQDETPQPWVNPRKPVCYRCGAPMAPLPYDVARREGKLGINILRCTVSQCGREWNVPAYPH